MLRNKYSIITKPFTRCKSLYFMWILFLSGTIFSARITDKFHMNGYSSFEFEFLLTAGEGDRNASFDADLFDLVFNFFPVERLRIATDITFEHGVSTESNRGNIAIEYAFPEFILRDWIKFRAGKMFCNFGLYNEVHTAKPAFITVKEPFSTNKNNKFGSEYRFYPRWVVGIAMLGDVGFSSVNLDYIIQISNGEQEFTNPFEEDNNIYKALGGRVRLMTENGINAGVSIYTDWLNKDDTSIDVIPLISGGGHLQLEIGSAIFELEGVAGLIDKKKRYGITALVAYDFGLHKIPIIGLDLGFEPYFRYELLKPNISINDNEAHLFVYGLRIAFTPISSIKLDLNTLKFNKNNIMYNGIKLQTGLKAALVVGF